MNEKEKKEYFNTFTENIYELIESGNDTDLVYRESIEHYGRLPKSLYRYVKLTEYNFDAIKNNYIFLSSINNLDDDFEGVINSDYKNIDDLKRLFLTEKYHSYFIETLLRKYGIYEQYAALIFKKEGIKDSKDLFFAAKYIFEDHKTSFGSLNDILNLYYGYTEGSGFMDRLIEITNGITESRNNTGVCCFTDDKNSQVMWNMYAENYSGCVIEYDISPFDLTTMIDLCPVLYDDERKHDPLKLAIDVAVDSYDKTVRDIDLGITRSKYKIVLTKNKEWSFQNEWRIVGPAEKKSHSPIIKAIYLGKNVSNEKKQKILELAELCWFKVYEQIFDNDNLRIAYREINNVPSFLTDKTEIMKRNGNSLKVELSYNEHESILYAIKLQRQLTSKEEKVDFLCKSDSYNFSMIASQNSNIRLFDVKYWKEVPQVEELKIILSDLLNKLIAFNEAENSNLSEINLIIVSRLFVLRTIQANINAFCKTKNTIVRYFEEETLREILDYHTK